MSARNRLRRPTPWDSFCEKCQRVTRHIDELTIRFDRPIEDRPAERKCGVCGTVEHSRYNRRQRTIIRAKESRLLDALDMPIN